MLSTEQLENAFGDDKLGAVYKGKKDYKLTSENGKMCIIHPYIVYPIVYLETENNIAIMGIDANNAVGISLQDPDFEIIDYHLLNPPC